MVEEAGDVFPPPQPKKVLSFNPGDLGSCLLELGRAVSLVVPRSVALLDKVRCGGDGLLENSDKTAACLGASAWEYSDSGSAELDVVLSPESLPSLT